MDWLYNKISKNQSSNSWEPTITPSMNFVLYFCDQPVEIPTVDQQIMQYTKTQYKIYFYNTFRKLNRIEQD